VPWGTLTRQQIVDTATELVTTGGYERLTLRGLAAELGVAPMSLYRHVRDKDDVLAEVVDRLLADAWQPGTSKRDWQGWLGEAANKLRRFLVGQPAAMRVYLSHPVVSPAAVARMEAMLVVLRPVVATEDDAHRAYAAIHTYTVGFAALESSRARAVSSEEPSDSLALRLAAFTTPRQFSDGLNYLLLGITNQGHQQ
jgi:TetR/AcrR family tetracycline transcriptional repressor